MRKTSCHLTFCESWKVYLMKLFELRQQSYGQFINQILMKVICDKCVQFKDFMQDIQDSNINDFNAQNVSNTDSDKNSDSDDDGSEKVC